MTFALKMSILNLGELNRYFFPNSFLILTVHMNHKDGARFPPPSSHFRWPMNYRYWQMPICHCMLLIFFARIIYHHEMVQTATYHHEMVFLLKRQKTPSSDCAVDLPPVWESRTLTLMTLVFINPLMTIVEFPLCYFKYKLSWTKISGNFSNWSKQWGQVPGPAGWMELASP